VRWTYCHRKVKINGFDHLQIFPIFSKVFKAKWTSFKLTHFKIKHPVAEHNRQYFTLLAFKMKPEIRAIEVCVRVIFPFWSRISIYSLQVQAVVRMPSLLLVWFYKSVRKPGWNVFAEVECLFSLTFSWRLNSSSRNWSHSNSPNILADLDNSGFSMVAKDLALFLITSPGNLRSRF